MQSHLYRVFGLVGLFIVYACIVSCAAAAPSATQRVGPANGGGTIVPTGQLIRPAGRVTYYNGRPIDLCLSPDGSRIFVKDVAGIGVIDAKTGEILQRLPYARGD